MDTAMHFEWTMKLFFGERADQIAGQQANPRHRREWIQKALKRLMRIVDTMDTTVGHKKSLMMFLENIFRELKATQHPSWDVVYSFLQLSSCLVGFCGAERHTAVYYQDADQYYTTVVLRGGKYDQRYQDKQDAISTRQEVVEYLKRKGLDSFKISLVLNTPETRVKQLYSKRL